MNDSSGMRARLMKECDWTTRFGLRHLRIHGRDLTYMRAPPMSEDSSMT